MKLNRKWVVPFILLLVIFSNTCKNNVGLGGHIDITPPTCQLTFPAESLPTIRNSFTLKGVATDDNIVDKVKVVVKSVDRAWEGAWEVPCTVEKSGDAWSWRVVLNKPNEDGSFPLKDGKYNITILAYDKDAKEGVTNSVLIVDNTPPVLFLQRPSSFATADKSKDKDASDNYGADLILKGTAADDSGLSSLELFAYGDKWEKQTINNVSTSINLKIDGFFSSTTEEKEIYRKLYGDEANAGLKTFPCAIKIYDNAKEYESPNSNGNSEKGNVSNDYYLYDALYNVESQKDITKQLIFPKYRVQDVYDMLKGTFYLNDKGVADAEKETEAKLIIEALKSGRFRNVDKRFRISCPTDVENPLTDENRALMGLFGLNPFKSPTFEVLGFDPCKIDFNETSHADVYNDYTRAKGGSLTIKVSPNLDDSPLKDARELEFYYCELSAFVKYFRDNNRVLDPYKEGFTTVAGVKKIEGILTQKVGSSYMATVPVGQDLDVGSSYVILVKGYDKEDNSVLLNPSSIKTNSVGTPSNVTYIYGVKIIGSGKVGDIKVTKIGIYDGGTNELSDRAFVKAGENVIFKFVASSETGPLNVSYSLMHGTNKKTQGQKVFTTASAIDQFEIEQLNFERGQNHTLIVKLVDSNAQETVRTYSVWCDDKAPEVNINPFEKFVNALPTISGRLSDVGSGVDISSLEVAYTYNGGATKTPINVIPVNAENGEWKLADISTPSEGLYKFFFNVGDKVGNKLIDKTAEVHLDKTPPILVITTTFPEWVNTKTYSVEGTANDSAAGVKVVKCEVNGVLQVLSGDNNWSGILEKLKEGNNTLDFFAEDKVGNKSNKTSKIIKVDTVLPILQFVKPESGEILLANSMPIGEIEVSASDNASGIEELRFGASGSSFASATPMTKSGNNYKANITSMPPASEYHFWAKDKAGNISEALKLKVKVDNEPASIRLEKVFPKVEIATETYTNKITTVTGSVSDGRGVKEISIVDEGGQPLKGFVQKDWDIEGNKKATFSFSFDTSQYSDNSTLKIKAIATDTAGNKSESPLFVVNIKQETDLPIVTISSFSQINNATLINSKRLTGEVKDDDGITSVKIKVNNDSFQAVTTQSKGADFWTWVYPLPVGIPEGEVKLEFEVIDSEGTTFTVGNVNTLNRVKVKGSDDGDIFKDADIKFNYDNTLPEISSKGVHFSLTPNFPAPSGSITNYSDVGELVGTNTVLGNANKKNISFRILAKDASGLKSAKLTLGAVTKDLPQGATQLSTVKEDMFDVIDFNNVDISSISEGSVPLKIEIVDNSGFVSTWQSTCIIDFKEPVVKITSPQDAVYFGDVSLMGKITDEPRISGNSVSGVDEISITYSIGNSGFGKEHRDGVTLLSSIENTSATWTIKIPNIKEYAKKDASDDSKYGATKPTGSSQIWSIPIIIKGKDKAGNEVISEAYNVKFDPNGDTPYIDILSPDNEAILGGTVVLSGTARVADPTSGKMVEKVYLQLSESSSFGNSWMIGTKDYGFGVEIASSTNILYWSHSFNATDLLSIGVPSREIYFRLRGESGTTLGEWTNPRKFTVSTDVAKFENVKLVNTNLHYDQAYEANAKWIKGDNYVIKGSVSHSTGIGKIDAKTGFVGTGIQALDQSGKTMWFTNNNTNFNIPIKTNQYPSKYGYIEFDIEATDARGDNNAKTVYQKVLLKYDNSIPSCAIGSPIVVDNAGFSGGNFTSSQELIKKDKAYYRVLVNGKIYKIKTIGSDGKEIELNDATELSGSFDYSIVKEPKIIERSDFQVEGVAEDSGSGVQVVRIKLEVSGTHQEVSIGSSDYSKFKRRRGNIISFNAGIDTTQVSNGKGKLTITVIDEAGNEITQTVEDVLVKNSPVIVKNLIFATDLSGNNAYESDEIYDCIVRNPKVAVENNWKLNPETNDFRGKIDVSSEFTYKNKTHSILKVVCNGGYKNIKASLYRVSASQFAQFDSLELEEFTNLGAPIQEVTNSNSSSTERELKLDLNNILSETDDGKGKFILKITDESIGNLWYAGMKIATKVEMGDAIDPKGVIFPFFYNSDKDKLETQDEQKLSSVYYEGKEAKGHIEIGNFEANAVSSVSGKVILRGFCYDNAKIKTINLTLPKDTKQGSSRTRGSETKTSNYNGSTWTQGLSIKKSNFTNNGHYVEWEYVWDSNRTLCANGVEIKLEVMDAKGRTSSETIIRPTIKQGVRVSDNDRAINLASGDEANKYDVVALTDKDEKIYFVSVSEMKGDKTLWNNVNVPINIESYVLYNGDVNVPSMRVNVVPYINKVTTSLSSYSTATPSLYDRTALGNYPCRDDETIRVEGFNLNDANFYVGNTNLGSSTTLNMASAKSGALDARVEYTDNSENKVIKSLNNTDDNDKAYNKCPNKINNDLLNNDVLLDVWGFKVGAKPTDGTITYPVMKVSHKDGKVGLAFANGVTCFNMPGFEADDKNWRSSRKFDLNWAQYVFTDFAFDDYGYSYGMATGVDMNKDENGGQGSASNSKFVARRAGDLNGYNNYGKRDNSKTGWGIRLENIGTTPSPSYNADPDRIQSPSIVTVKDGRLSEDKIELKRTTVYLAYYDAINKHIRYRWGTVKNKSKNKWGNYSEDLTEPVYGDNSTEGQFVDLKGYGRLQDSSSADYSILAGPGDQGSTGEDTAGKYVSLGAIKNGAGSKDVVVALWYNFKARSLMYAYTDDPRKDNVTWKGVQTVGVGGEYVKCAIDGNRGIHVAYYSKGDLKYAYLSSYDATNWKIATVDSYSLTGTHISLDLAKDPSTMKWVPYIGYYMAGNANARLAYLVGGVDSNVSNGAGTDEKYTGKWEISIVPTQKAIREYRISVGVYADSNAGGVLSRISEISDSVQRGESIVGGNGTANPILGYAVEEDGAFELAQKK
ncbi:MAG: hypothetical protein ACTTJ6_06630 [Treponema sp.]